MYVASNGTKTAVILQDTDPQNPRDPGWQENLGKMVCCHGAGLSLRHDPGRYPRQQGRRSG